MEASALNHASRRGLLARRSPLLKLQGDEKLIAMVRAGDPSAFEMIVDRYQGRLLGFCRQMLNSTEDAEDVLQEVFVNAHRAMLRDEREINLRPWLYRIARNRCLNHLRKPTADAQESMDMVPAVEASSTAERVHNREEFRQILGDVNKLPETQRSALLLREMDALSYEEIAAAMDTTVPSVKSLLVRARISLAEASQARLLTCNEVHVELSEAAEGLRKVSAPVRRHIRECEECADFRSKVRSNEKMLAALFPVGPLIAFKVFLAGKLGLGGGAATAGGGASAAGAGAAGAAGAASVGAGAVLSGGAASGLSVLGAGIGTKAVAGALTAAVITAGAVEVKHLNTGPTDPAANVPAKVQTLPPSLNGGVEAPAVATVAPAIERGHVAPAIASAETEAEPVATPVEEPVPPVVPAEEEAATDGTGGVPASEEEGEAGSSLAESGEGIAAATPSNEAPGAHGADGTVIVTVGGPPPAPPAPEASAPPPPPATTIPPIEINLPPSTLPEEEAAPPATEAEP